MEPVKIILVGSNDVIHDDFAKAMLEYARFRFDILIEPKYKEEQKIEKKERSKIKKEADQDCRALTKDEIHNQYRKHVLRMTGGRRQHNGK